MTWWIWTLIGIYVPPVSDKLDLLSDGPPAEWASTRHCPTCSSAALSIASDDPFGGGWCTTFCLNCGRKLRVDRLDGPPWEDTDWIRSGEQ